MEDGLDPVPGRTSPTRTPNRPPLPPNVSNVVLGNLHIKPWYPSFYPEEMVGGSKADWLYVCQWCFKYTPEIMKFSAHCVRGVSTIVSLSPVADTIE